MKEFTWTTRRGKKIKLKDMETGHVYNCMRFLIGCLILDPVYNKFLSGEEMVEKLRSHQNSYDVMEKELNRRLYGRKTAKKTV